MSRHIVFVASAGPGCRRGAATTIPGLPDPVILLLELPNVGTLGLGSGGLFLRHTSHQMWPPCRHTSNVRAVMQWTTAHMRCGYCGTHDVWSRFQTTPPATVTPPPPVSNEQFCSDRIFSDPIPWVPGVGTDLLRHRLACPTKTPVRTVFFEGFIVGWTWGGGVFWPTHRAHTIRGCNGRPARVGSSMRGALSCSSWEGARGQHTCSPSGPEGERCTSGGH